MSKKNFIKICGITSPELAYQAAKLGADFVGLVFYSGSQRNVDLAVACDIASQARAGGAVPVAVFVDSSLELMLEICGAFKIDYVQLHGAIAKDEGMKLPDRFRRIYAIDVKDDGTIIKDEKINGLNKQRDFLIYDGINHGSGKKFSLDNFKPFDDFNFFLAGGLTANNVAQAIVKAKPYGVDVSSGVESRRGVKDIKLIENFIKEVRL
jgi:phosphoribosylanthranilate isomerase